MASHIMTSDLPRHCTPTTSFLSSFSSFFHTCVPTPLAFASTLLGILSIISWLFAQLPQIIKNIGLQSASGLSIYFLAEWLLGDLSNLVGALLTRQATWQVVVAAYYVSVDIALVSQYIWYSHAKPWREKRRDTHTTDGYDGHDGDTTNVIIGVSPSSDSSILTSESDSKNGYPRSTPKKKSFAKSPNDHQPTTGSSASCNEKSKMLCATIPRAKAQRSFSSSPQAMLWTAVVCTNAVSALVIPKAEAVVATTESHSETIGRIFSWASSVLYLGSRLPQIYKNHDRRSTSGLSPTLFIAAFCGNFFYSASMLANPQVWSSYPAYGLHGWVGPEGSDRHEHIALGAPFFLGAAGVLSMDAIIGVQFMLFGEARAEKMVIVEDERGRNQWQRVSGWMRGWVPSPSPFRVINEDERPLLEREEEPRYGAAV